MGQSWRRSESIKMHGGTFWIVKDMKILNGNGWAWSNKIIYEADGVVGCDYIGFDIDSSDDHDIAHGINFIIDDIKSVLIC